MVREPYIQNHIEIPKLKVNKFRMEQLLASLHLNVIQINKINNLFINIK